MTPPSPLVVAIDDEVDLLELIRATLERSGFRVLTARSAEEGIRTVKANTPQVILLDIMLPGMSGFDACKEFRRIPETSAIPLIMLTAKGEEADVVRGLDMGADDYIVKPFRPKVLTARIKALLRRSDLGDSPSQEQMVRGPLSIDGVKHEVRLDGKELHLTLTEFRILQTLASKPGRVFSRDSLLDAIQDSPSEVIDRTVDVHIASVRKKLGSAGPLIQTVRGVGYKFGEPLV